MSRPLRIEFPGAWYHVMNRGSGRKSIFRTSDHRKLFLTLLGEAVSAFQWEVHAYCLMGNHYHLLIHTPLGNLGRAMRHLNGVYTQRFNRSVGTDGPLFRGRYKAILVDADHYLLQVSRYIHRNPLEAHQGQQMMDPLWSSYPFYLDWKKKCGWLFTFRLLEMAGATNARNLYRKYVEETVEDEVTEFYSKGRFSPVLGSEGFLEGIEEFIHRQTLSPEITGVRHLREAPSIKNIQQVCAAYFRISMKEVQRSRPGKINGQRDIAIYLSRNVGRYPLAEIAKHFDSISYSGVSKALGRVKLKIETEKTVVGTLKKLNKLLVNK